MENFDLSEYNSVDHSYHTKADQMYRYVIHIKPYVIAALKEPGADVDAIVTIYANIAKAFGEFNQMKVAHMPNIQYKKAFFSSQVDLFDGLLREYTRIVPGDNLELTEFERSATLG